MYLICFVILFYFLKEETHGILRLSSVFNSTGQVICTSLGFAPYTDSHQPASVVSGHLTVKKAMFLWAFTVSFLVNMSLNNYHIISLHGNLDHPR